MHPAETWGDAAGNLPTRREEGRDAPDAALREQGAGQEREQAGLDSQAGGRPNKLTKGERRQLVNLVFRERGKSGWSRRRANRIGEARILRPAAARTS